MHNALGELLEQTVLYSSRLVWGRIILGLFWLASSFGHRFILKAV